MPPPKIENIKNPIEKKELPRKGKPGVPPDLAGIQRGNSPFKIAFLAYIQVGNTLSKISDLSPFMSVVDNPDSFQPGYCKSKSIGATISPLKMFAPRYKYDDSIKNIITKTISNFLFDVELAGGFLFRNTINSPYIIIETDCQIIFLSKNPLSLK
jgi:hypothetical protein